MSPKSAARPFGVLYFASHCALQSGSIGAIVRLAECHRLAGHWTMVATPISRELPEHLEARAVLAFPASFRAVRGPGAAAQTSSQIPIYQRVMEPVPPS